jgi:hypothetical protein
MRRIPSLSIRQIMSSLPIGRMRAATISRRRNSVPTPRRRRVTRLDPARD